MRGGSSKNGRCGRRVEGSVYQRQGKGTEEETGEEKRVGRGKVLVVGAREGGGDRGREMGGGATEGSPKDKSAPDTSGGTMGSTTTTIVKSSTAGITETSFTDKTDGARESKPRPPPVDVAAAQIAGQDGGIKTPTPGQAQTPRGGPARYDTFRDKERKIGHRRVDEGGTVTYKKIGTSTLMNSIQLGIQQAVGSLASKPELDLLIQDFYEVEMLFFPAEGSQSTPAHPSTDFRFKVYAPTAFRHFRDLFRIQPDDYLVSLCTEPLRELSNPGASGSIFYLTNDDEFIIKTVQHKEAEFLQKLLPGYYMNLNQNPRTLLPKFFGLYNYQCNAKNIRLIVMNNLLPSSIKMHQRYDLKGSTYKRKANKYERSKDSPTFKDLDFLEHHTEGILLEAETHKALISTIARDCRVLTSFKIMDYSLLVGVHNLDLAAKKKAQDKERRLNGGGEGSADVGGATLEGLTAEGSSLTRSRSINRHKLVAHSTAMESIQADSDPIDEEDQVPPGGIPARNAKGERLLLFLGIIDILQSFRLKKKLEHTFKSMIHDGDTISVHRPTFYAQRFLKFMEHTVFKKIPSPLRHSPSRRRGASVRIPLRPMSQTDPDHAQDTHELPEGAGGRVPGGSVSADDRPGEAAASLTVTSGPPTPATAVSAATVTSSLATSSTTTSGAVSGTPVSGAGPPSTPGGGVGTPSTPVNLPAVLQDRHHSTRGRVPPPVPPRSPRGGSAQSTTAPSPYSLARGGVAYLTMPPSPRFVGGSPRFSHLCSPSIGMAGYNIWHADSVCRLDRECMMQSVHGHGRERQHHVWQVPTEDVLALQISPGGTPHPHFERRGSAIHAVREVWDAIKTASHPGTPLQSPPVGINQFNHSYFHRPMCLSSQNSDDQSKQEYVLPDTHITSPEQDYHHHQYSSHTSHQYSKVGLHQTPYPESEYPDTRISQTSKGHTETINKSPPTMLRTSHVDHIIPKKLSETNMALGRKCWNKAEELTLFAEQDGVPGLGTQRSCERNSFAGIEGHRILDSDLKRNSMIDQPSAKEEEYIRNTLSRYLARSRSPSPYESRSTNCNSNSPSPYHGSLAQLPRTPSPLCRPLATQVATVSDADLSYSPSHEEPRLAHNFRSSPNLGDSLPRLEKHADNHHKQNPGLKATFYSQVECKRQHQQQQWWCCHSNQWSPSSCLLHTTSILGLRNHRHCHILSTWPRKAFSYPCHNCCHKGGPNRCNQGVPLLQSAAVLTPPRSPMTYSSMKQKCLWGIITSVGRKEGSSGSF
ncbi:hypothetical protein Pcinc_026191 [Petrolisthes cinctipes]|uniref:PIPK domain-containing protein n=1 Tax=Petrolisthes cinctipes TaxID=88211 RepID=A0AAE1F775_PETCI|nr:hypothetical protein Pcinc_026191 [Petrolisthes cinctipes]